MCVFACATALICTNLGLLHSCFSQVPEEAGLRLVQTPSAKSYQKCFPYSVHKKKVKVFESSWRYERGRLALLLAKDCPKIPWPRMGDSGTAYKMCQSPVCLTYRLLKLSSSEISSDCAPAASSKSKKNGET